MVTGLLSRFRALFSKPTTAEFQPKVTKMTPNSFFSELLVFEDSTTLLSIQEERLFISFDNGLNWERSDEVPVDILGVEIDKHYRNSRAVAMGYGELYLTEDQGKHWRKLNLPGLEQYELDTHPFEKDYLLASCMVCLPVDEACKENSDDDDSICQGYSYVSNDGGKNFRKIELSHPNCEFGCKSRNSIFYSNKDLVYGFDGAIGGNVFYTDDFGKSIKFFDQFNDHTVLSLRILDSHILVFTVGNKFDECLTDECLITDLWVSNDGFTFDKAFLPGVIRNPVSLDTIEDGLGRIIITTSSSGMKEHSSPIFISDPSGLQFRFLDIGIKDTLVSSRLTTSKTLKGTMWARLTFKHPDKRGYRSHCKISSDYGETWSNLRVIRSPGQRKDLFPCDIDDMESCSLEPYLLRDIESSGTAGILMTLGAVSKDAARDDKTMTFISRDGGRSWEVAFEYPCLWAFGDGGNIVVAIPFSSYQFGNNAPSGKFYYSLDEGKTWKEYQLEAPVELGRILSTASDGSGLNFIFSGACLGESLLYIVDFTGAFNGQSCGSKGLET